MFDYMQLIMRFVVERASFFQIDPLTNINREKHFQPLTALMPGIIERLPEKSGQDENLVSWASYVILLSLTPAPATVTIK